MLYENISVSACKKLIDEQNGSVYLLDVREQFECEKGMIAGAHNIALGELERRVDELPQDKKIIVYCATGNRSQVACSILLAAGRNNCANLEGGIFTWSRAGYEVV